MIALKWGIISAIGAGLYLSGSLPPWLAVVLALAILGVLVDELWNSDELD
jgi:hypothetical protein